MQRSIIMTKESPYIGRILRVDLSTGKISKELFEPKLLRMFVGGNGVGIKILYDEVPPGVKPYDPENRLILAAGPLNGTRVPGSGCISVVTKGPMTNLLTSAQANGFFGARMRFAGYDAIVIQGTSPEWEYLWIHEGEAELRPADHLLGLDTWETEGRLKEELGQKRASVACIGPSGENLVPFSAICCDHGHVASTNGPGAVMGSKRLKAVVVFGQKSSVEVWDSDRLNTLARGDFLRSAEESFMGAMIKSVGTHGYFATMYPIGGVTIKNYTTNEWSTIAKYYGENIRARFERKPRPCWACPWAHCAETKVTEGPLTGYEGEEPEFEQLTAWSMNIGNDDIGWAIKLGNLNDGMGMDVKECTYAISLAMECYEKGIIGLKETGGLELKWGNTEAVAQLIEDIAHRRGFGAVLADGVKKAAERIGGEAPNLAVYMGRGLAPHVVDPRGYWPLYFCMSLSDTGSFYGTAGQDPDLGLMDQVGLHDTNKIPLGQAKGSCRWVFMDAVGVCMFFLMGRLGPIAETVAATTGWHFTVQELLEVGERITAISRAFNIRHGLVPEQDYTVSPRYESSPSDGPFKGVEVGPVQAKVAREYYQAKGWDAETSKPLPETLHRLGLDSIVKDLWG